MQIWGQCVNLDSVILEINRYSGISVKFHKFSNIFRKRRKSHNNTITPNIISMNSIIKAHSKSQNLSLFNWLWKQNNVLWVFKIQKLHFKLSMCLKPKGVDIVHCWSWQKMWRHCSQRKKELEKENTIEFFQLKTKFDF